MVRQAKNKQREYRRGVITSQIELLSYIKNFAEKHGGFSPTYKEIAQEFGGKTTTCAYNRCKYLEARGYLEITGKTRGLRVISIPEVNNNKKEVKKNEEV